MSTKPLQAYKVHDGQDSCVVVFATNGASARRLGANDMDCEFQDVESCRRMPEFDQYAPGPVPALAMIAAGWWYECCGCGQKVDDDSYDYEREAPVQPVVHGNNVYCCAGCRHRHLAAVAREQKVIDETIEAMVGLVVARYPGVLIHSQHVYVTPGFDDWPEVEQAYVRFYFPGSRYFGAELRYEHAPSWRGGHRLHYGTFVAGGDKDAWEAWLAAGCPPEMASAQTAA